ncbi:MAG: hypothetical protein WBN24_13930, partial [Acidimicrobiia bacterium]
IGESPESTTVLHSCDARRLVAGAPVASCCSSARVEAEDAAVGSDNDDSGRESHGSSPTARPRR